MKSSWRRWWSSGTSCSPVRHCVDESIMHNLILIRFGSTVPTIRYEASHGLGQPRTQYKGHKLMLMGSILFSRARAERCSAERKYGDMGHLSARGAVVSAADKPSGQHGRRSPALSYDSKRVLSIFAGRRPEKGSGNSQRGIISVSASRLCEVLVPQNIVVKLPAVCHGAGRLGEQSLKWIPKVPTILQRE